MNISREQILALAEVKTTNVSVELYVAGVKAREWLGCGDWNVDAAQKIADEINGKAVIRDEAAIAAYKAELLKEAGEPVAHLRFWAGQYYSGRGDIEYDEGFEVTRSNKEGDDGSEAFPVFTSDQVAAAVAKATKPLEEEVAVLKETKENIWSALKTVETQLAAAQEEIERLQELVGTDASVIAELHTQLADKSTESDRRLNLMNQLDANNEELRAQLVAAQEENKLIMLNLTQCGEQLVAAQEEIERLKRSIKLEQQLSDSLKMAARMPGTGNYVDWIKNIRNSHDQLATAEQRVAEACAKFAEYLCDRSRFYRYEFTDGVRRSEYRKFMKGE
ncbi:hypothetical protein AB6Q56_14655 [Dechloromonas sp. ARDL1]|uniref:hypothetical protein n=1 Tax=Dechloromonas sp. ARDL1 TaxID=3322121 RepID=UPI003DA6D1C5